MFVCDPLCEPNSLRSVLVEKRNGCDTRLSQRVRDGAACPSSAEKHHALPPWLDAVRSQACHQPLSIEHVTCLAPIRLAAHRIDGADAPSRGQDTIDEFQYPTIVRDSGDDAVKICQRLDT